MNEASLTTGGTRGAAVRLERDLPEPPEVVWRSLTDREQLKTWFPCDVIVADGRWEPGSAISFPFGPEAGAMTLEGQVLEAREPEALAYTWGEETLRFSVAPHGTGTLLTLTDELRPAVAARNAAGWEGCLDLLAGGKPDKDAWRPRFEHYVAKFAPTLGEQEGPPPGMA
jgi:uncharacterized protein YndB with AHSA1/START domain